MKCKVCCKNMQEIFTKSSQTLKHARVGYLCPFCDYVLIDEWDNGDYHATLTKKTGVEEMTDTKTHFEALYGTLWYANWKDIQDSALKNCIAILKDYLVDMLEE